MTYKKMNILEDDILNITHGIIAHQVNCQKVMGAGLAKAIKNKYPCVFQSYYSALSKCPDRLGSSQIIQVYPSSSLFICNLFAQDKYGTDKQYTDYLIFESCLQNLRSQYQTWDLLKDLPVYFPYKIGCGLGGGDWSIIYKLIYSYFPQSFIVKLRR